MACLQKYHIGSQIGSGGCGTVRMIHNLSTLEKFAMKSIKKETNPMVLVRNNNKILNEVNIMKRISHVHVLKMMDFYETPERVIIVMDFMEGIIINFIINNMYYKHSSKVATCCIASHDIIRIANV